MYNKIYFPWVDKLVEERRNAVHGSNGFILGAPGSGRYQIAIEQILSILQNTDDEVIVLDTYNEYRHLIKDVDYQEILICYGSKFRINPLDIGSHVDDKDSFIREKVDFIISLCGVLSGPLYGLSPGQKTIVDFCVHEVYKPFFESKNEDTGEYDYTKIPTMKEFYDVLRKQVGFDALLLADMLEMYVTGCANLFNCQTNVKHDNSFVIYDLLNLGSRTGLKDMGIMVVLDYIWNRYGGTNNSENKRIWVFIDDVSLLFQTKDSSEYLKDLFMKSRESKCIFTGVTSNIFPAICSQEGYSSILPKCNYLHLLNLPPLERKEIGQFLNLPEEQLAFVTDAPAYQGLVYLEDKLFEFPKYLGVMRVSNRDPRDGSWVEEGWKDINDIDIEDTGEEKRKEKKWRWIFRKS